MRCIIFIGLVICLSSVSSLAQDNVVEASGTATGMLDASLSLDDLKERLKNEAIKQALEEVYGISVGKWSDIKIEDGHADVTIEGETFVRGEWLKTTYSHCEEKWVERKRKQKELWVTCSVKGLVRSSTEPQLPLYWQTARCNSLSCRTGEFNSGEPLYAFFKTPANGWLSIYSLENDGVYRLLPYQKDEKNFRTGLYVKSDSLYTLFDSNELSVYSTTDELVMTTTYNYEDVELYFIFSTDTLALLPIDGQAQLHESSQWILPSKVNKQQFLNWITECRIKSEDFYVRKSKIRINGH